MFTVKSPGAYTHYLQAPCKPAPPINKVRTWPHHPLRTYFNDSDRKAYVIENRTATRQLLSISDHTRKVDATTKYFTLEAFSEESFYVNLPKEYQQFVRLHDPQSKQVIRSKYLNPVYSLMSIMGGIEGDCRPHLQLQMTPGW